MVARRRRVEAAATVQPSTPRDFDGLAYFEVGALGPDQPGLKSFACEPLSATMTVKGCGRRWTDAQEAEGERAEAYGPCRGCVMGAAHAGRDVVAYSGIYGKQICPRCRKGTTRMIGGTRCVSCYNREGEMKRGRNARGNPPKTLMRDRAYREVNLTVIVDGAPRRVTAPSAAHTMEPVLQSMRTLKGDLAFAYAGPPTGGLPFSQPRLL